MKTPREILLEQHESVQSKLDAIRAEVVAGLKPPPKPFSWLQLLRSMRWHIAGMSAAWVVIAVLNKGESSGSVAMISREKPPTPQQLWASVRENRRLLREYMDTPVAEAVTPVPVRRSQVNPQQEVV